MTPQQRCRIRRIKAKLCVDCGLNPPWENRNRCEWCLVYISQARQKRHAERRAAGLCVLCGDHKEPEHQRCGRCRARGIENRRQARAEQRERQRVG
jgi:hypothetical protein